MCTAIKKEHRLTTNAWIQINTTAQKFEKLTCLPCLCIWSMAAYTSSTISTVQARELYSWCNEGAFGIFSKELVRGPPTIATPEADGNNYTSLQNKDSFENY